MHRKLSNRCCHLLNLLYSNCSTQNGATVTNVTVIRSQAMKLQKQIACAFALSMAVILFPAHSSSARKMVTDNINLSTPDDATVKAATLSNKAALLIQQGKWEEARSALEAAVKFDPNRATKDVHGNLAVVLEHFKRYDLAIVHLKISYKLAPTDPAVLEQMGAYYQMTNDPQQAVPYLETYLKLYPKTNDAPTIKMLVADMKKMHLVKAPLNASDYFADATRQELCRFQTTSAPLKVFIEPADTVTGYKKQYDDFLVAAFDSWTAASQALTWTRVDNAGDATIVCKWSPKASWKHAEAGQAESKILNNSIQSSVITILTLPPLGGDLTDDTVKYICLHEVGHAMGLLGHSQSNNDVMYFSETEGMPQELSARDKATIARLYKSDMPAGNK